MLWLLAVIPAGFILYGAHRYLLDKRYRLPPGPTPLPFIGNFYNISPSIPLWQNMRDLSQKFGPVFTFYMGQIRMVVLGDSKIIHQALVSQGDTFSSRIEAHLPGFERIPAGIVSASGDIWRQRRRFGMRAMRDFGMGKDAIVNSMHDEIVHFLPEIESYKGKPFNPRILINNAVSNVICSIVFGKRFNYDDEKFHRILHSLERLSQSSHTEGALFFMFPFKKYFSTPSNVIWYEEFVDTVKAMVNEAIAEHRKDFDRDHIRDFPDLFLRDELEQDGMDLESFLLIMCDFFPAGTETTSTALTWTLIYLTAYPEVQAKCHEVIDNVIDTARLPTSKDRPNMVYMDAVMCEVLRHVSFLPTSLFHTNLEKPAQIAGYGIPPYTVIMYNVAALHRDPTYWKDPEVFNPNRWISADGKLLSHSSHFMPFGLGPRVCLGESLARVEYFIFLVSMLHRFRFTIKEPVDLFKEKEGIIRAPPAYEIMAQER